MAFDIAKFSEYVNKTMKDGMSVHSKMYALGQVSIIATLYNALFTVFDSPEQTIKVADIDQLLRTILKENPDVSRLLRKFVDDEEVTENVEKENKKDIQGEGNVVEFKSISKESKKRNRRTGKKFE